MNDNITYLTVPEYAARVGVTKQAVYLQIKQNKIKTKEMIENGKIIKYVMFNGESAILQGAEESAVNEKQAEESAVNQVQEPVKQNQVNPVNQNQEEVKQSKAHTEEYIAHLEAEISALREQLKSSQEQNQKLTETLNATLQVAAQAQQITTQAQILHKLAAAPEEETPPEPQDKPGFFNRIFKKNKGSV